MEKTTATYYVYAETAGGRRYSTLYTCPVITRDAQLQDLLIAIRETCGVRETCDGMDTWYIVSLNRLDHPQDNT